MIITRRKLTLATATLAVAVLCVACGGDDGPSTPPTPTSVGGTATKGGIAGATVNLHRFTAAGGMGAALAGPFTTDAAGAWTGEVPAGTSETLLVVVSGGSYADEATGSTIAVSTDLYGIWRPSTAKGNASPVTHAMVLNARQRIVEGATLATALTGVIAGMESALGFDATAVAPLLPTKAAGLAPHKAPAETTAEAYALFLAGFSALLDGNGALGAFAGADVWEMVIALVRDLSDGVLDGMDVFGDAILVDPDGSGAGTPIAWPALDATGIGALIAAANAWGAAHTVGFTLPAIDLTDFGDTGPGGTGGETTVTGTLTVGGSDAGLFGAQFTPTAAGAGINPIAVVFSCVALPNQNMLISLTRSPDKVVGVAVAAAERAWAAPVTPPASVPGVTVNTDGSFWTFVFSGTQLNGAQGATGNLVLNGTLVFDVAQEE